MLCVQCNVNEIPTGRKKYCSYLCLKRNWYLKNTSFKNSAILHGSSFDSCTQKGLYWEEYSANRLSGVCISSERMNQNIDIIVNGKNYDVKSCNLYKRKLKRGKAVDPEKIFGTWVFNRNTFKSNVDFLLCICLKCNDIVKSYLIPNEAFPRKGICIGKNSKYDKYLITI